MSRHATGRAAELHAGQPAPGVDARESHIASLPRAAAASTAGPVVAAIGHTGGAEGSDQGYVALV